MDVNLDNKMYELDTCLNCLGKAVHLDAHKMFLWSYSKNDFLTPVALRIGRTALSFGNS